MIILTIGIDADTERYLRVASVEHCASIEWLAEAAVAEAALKYARDNDLIDWSAPKGRRDESGEG